MLLSLSLIFLTSCGPATLSSVCPPPVEYTDAQQAQLANELEPIPVDSMVMRVILDFRTVNGELRACRRM